MEKSSMPPGFRFNPTDVELVQYYLKRKIMGKRIHVKVVAEVDIYKWAPWDLPGQSCWQGGDLKWYFFCPREKKYAKGGRLNRATGCGYWKTTGKDRSVLYNSEVVGWIKTLIFHTGRAPSGERTNWVLHEYRLEDKNLVDKGVAQDSYVLCIVFQKDGIGPRNNKQYGAPFNEEDWTDDEVETDVVALVNMTEPILVHTNMLEPEPNLTHSQILEIDTVQANIHEQAFVNTNIYEPYLVNSNMPEPYPVYPNLPQPDFCFANMSEPFLSQPSNYNSSITRTNSSESCASDVLPPSTATLQPGPSNYIATDPVSPDNDILSMLDALTEEDNFSMDVSYQTKGLDNLNCSGDACPMADVGRLDDTDKYLGGSSKAGYSFPCGAISEVPIVNEPYLELFDLDKPLGGDNYLFPMISPPRTLGGETPYEEDLFFPWRDEL